VFVYMGGHVHTHTGRELRARHDTSEPPLPGGTAALWPPAMIFNLVDGPDGALDVLHSHEALVEGQVVSHSVLFGQ
jgi:hypothetical protein